MASGMSGAISPSAIPELTAGVEGAATVVEGPHPNNTTSSPFTNPGSAFMVTFGEPELQLAVAESGLALTRAP